MSKLNLLFAFFLFMLSQQAVAVCLKSMPIQQLVDCLTIENTGVNYQQWQKDIAESVRLEVRQANAENKHFIIAQNTDSNLSSEPQ